MDKAAKRNWRLGLGICMAGVGAIVVGMAVAGQVGAGFPVVWRRSPEKKPEIYFDEPARMSEGEQLILALDRNPFKEAGILAYRKRNFEDAVYFFQNALQFHRDPETLIYLNNARVMARVKASRGKESFLTLAVTVNLPDDWETEIAKKTLQGVAQAQKDFVEQGNNLKIIIGDDDNDLASTVALAQKFVETQDLLGVIGHYSSSKSLAAAEIYQAAGLVMVTPASAEVSIVQKGNFIFRTAPNNLDASVAITHHIRDQFQVGKVGVFYSGTSPYSLTLKQLLVEHLNEEDNVATVERDIDEPELDVKAAFDEFRQEEVEAIILLVDRYTSNRGLDVIEENNRALPIIIGDDAIANDWTSEAEASISLGLVAPAPWHALENPSALFPVDSRDLWIQNVSWLTAMSYDATQVFIEAFQQMPDYTRQGVQEVLVDPNFVARGAADEIQFTEVGDRRHEITMVEVVKDNQARFGYSFVPFGYDFGDEIE